MNRETLAKKYLTEQQYEIRSRTQLKINNMFPRIAEDLWISKQAVQQAYISINKRLDRLSLKYGKDEI